MNERAKRCARPGCNRSRQAKQLACRDDWFALSAQLRNKISATYYAKRREQPGAEIEHREALVAALREWRDLGG